MHAHKLKYYVLILQGAKQEERAKKFLSAIMHPKKTYTFLIFKLNPDENSELLNKVSKEFSCLRQVFLYLLGTTCFTLVLFWFYCFNKSSPLKLFYQHHNVTITNHQKFDTTHILPFQNLPLNRTIIFLLWTKFLGDATWQRNLGFKTLSKGQNCEFTSEKNILSQADYVIFQSMSLEDYPPIRLPHNRWIFFNLEPPIPTYNGWWLNTTFNYSSTYSLHSDFPQPYGKCVQSVNGMNDNVNHISDVIRRKSALVTWFVTNCDTQSQRLQYAKKLKNYIQVDIYGRCSDLQCSKSDKQCVDSINQKYKFYLSFENSLCKDYVTEKAFRPMISDYPMVPIVMSYANYSEILPPHSFIDVRWFKSPKDLAQYLNYLDKNDTEYKKYFEWRHTYKCGFFTLNFTSFCERAHALYRTYSPLSHNVAKFNFVHECITPENFYQD